MLGTLVGFLPLIAYWLLVGFGDWTYAVLAGLIKSLLLVLFRVRTRNFKTMEVVTLGYFAVNALVTFGSSSLFFQTYGALTVKLTLATMAFGSLLMKSPFTFEYARESWDRSYWDDPRFRRTNEIITAVWGMLFLIGAALGELSVAFPSAKFVLATVVPNAATAAGLVFSARFPAWYARWLVAGYGSMQSEAISDQAVVS